MIQINEISFAYKSISGRNSNIFDNLSFRINKGEFVSVLGRSGCGKTTLANILAGYIRPDKGDITINKVIVTKPGKNRILVNQQHDLFDWMTVEQNMYVAEKNPKSINNSLSLVHLEKYKNLYPTALSGGQKKKLSLARAIAAKPKFIILDEPFSFLDRITKQELQTELENLFTLTKKTTLLVTHDIDEAILLSDRIIVLKGAPAKVVYEAVIRWPHPRKIGEKNNNFFSKMRNKILSYY